MNWEITYYDDAVQGEVLGLSAGFLTRYLRCLKAAEGISRVFFCTMVGKKIVILHQFIKKTDKTPRKEFGIARRRMKEVKKC